MKRVTYDEFFESTRGRVIGAVRRGRVTVDEIAKELGLTGNAVRAQLASLQRDGLVRTGGVRRGATRPAQTYVLTPELDHLLSRAYIPLLTQLVRLFAADQPTAKFNAIMREAGRGLAREITAEPPAGTLKDRADAACRILNRELGASTIAAREDGAFVIRGSGCPLAALTGKHRGVCLSIETLLTTLLATSVQECCERSERPRCCFRIEAAPETSRATDARRRPRAVH